LGDLGADLKIIQKFTLKKSGIKTWTEFNRFLIQTMAGCGEHGNEICCILGCDAKMFSW
jgi:hypothetical protein